MLFRKCSINGRCYGDLTNALGETIEIDDGTAKIDFSGNRWHEPGFRFYDKSLLDDTKQAIFEVTLSSNKIHKVLLNLIVGLRVLETFGDLSHRNAGTKAGQCP